jgi:hypothetical protein
MLRLGGGCTLLRVEHCRYGTRDLFGTIPELLRDPSAFVDTDRERAAVC